jgi:Ca-activated chloride channel homolog
MSNFVFKTIWVLAALPLAGVFIYFAKKNKGQSALKFSSTALLKPFKPTLKVRFWQNIFYLRALAIIFFLIALAGPRLGQDEAWRETEGVDIVLAIDSSGSMLAEDFTILGVRHNRLSVVKKVAADFIKQRTNDRIGIVTFAALAYTVCPLTLDHDWVLQNLERVEIGAIKDGTAIGSAISSSLNRLKKTKAKSKIIILLTDGANNAGNISPLAAAKIAKSLGIKVYIIGVGSTDFVPYPAQDMFGRKVYRQVKIEIDEATLKAIAAETKARYWNANNTEALKNIYKEIDSLERTVIEEKGYRRFKELFHIPLLIALGFLLSEIILTRGVLRSIP